mmetsp:Transcript_10842/g.19305  ORF Transcript_10842/g.19305 Transcript_10842/m.19305 type:complete len:264 (+) Transcript_10842:800-1591(+)
MVRVHHDHARLGRGLPHQPRRVALMDPALDDVLGLHPPHVEPRREGVGQPLPQRVEVEGPRPEVGVQLDELRKVLQELLSLRVADRQRAAGLAGHELAGDSWRDVRLQVVALVDELAHQLLDPRALLLRHSVALQEELQLLLQHGLRPPRETGNLREINVRQILRQGPAPPVPRPPGKLTVWPHVTPSDLLGFRLIAQQVPGDVTKIKYIGGWWRAVGKFAWRLQWWRVQLQLGGGLGDWIGSRVLEGFELLVNARRGLRHLP